MGTATGWAVRDVWWVYIVVVPGTPGVCEVCGACSVLCPFSLQAVALFAPPAPTVALVSVGEVWVAAPCE